MNGCGDCANHKWYTDWTEEGEEYIDYCDCSVFEGVDIHYQICYELANVGEQLITCPYWTDISNPNA